MSENVRKLLSIPRSLSATRILGKLGLQQNVQKRVVVGHRLENRQSLIIKSFFCQKMYISQVTSWFGKTIDSLLYEKRLESKL